MHPKAKKWAIYLVLLIGVWFTVHTVYIYVDGTENPDCTTDVAVILGNKVEEDGTPSARLQARLDRGVELFQSNKTHYFIVSGGHGKEGFYEADKMREYLLAKGIPDDKIIVDNHGDNTLKTAINTKAICKQRGFGSVTVVSQWFHITRTKHFFKNSGLEICSASPHYFEWWDLYAVPREFVAFYRYLL